MPNFTTSYPLAWPLGWARTDPSARYIGPDKMPSSRIRQLLMFELEKLGAEHIVISTDVALRRDGLPYAGQAPPKDPGVVLFFNRNGQDIALPCDKYKSVDANLRAIGLTVEAMRGIERWGTKQMMDRAFTGYKALPESVIVTPHMSRAWWEVLQVQQTADMDVIRAAYMRLLHKVHPDKGGTDAAFQELQDALRMAKESKQNE